MVWAARVGYRSREVPVRHRRRSGGSSKVGGTLLGSIRAGWYILSTVFRYSLDTARKCRTASEGGALMADALYIIAKAPRVGLAKTRLGLVIGHESAIALYKAFLQDLAARFVDGPFECGWYVTPPDAWEEISTLVGWGEREARVLFQKEGDLTARQREFFRGAAAGGEGRGA